MYFELILAEETTDFLDCIRFNFFPLLDFMSFILTFSDLYKKVLLEGIIFSKTRNNTFREMARAFQQIKLRLDELHVLVKPEMPNFFRECNFQEPENTAVKQLRRKLNFSMKKMHVFSM